MADVLQCAPQGFSETIADANRLTQQMLSEICHDVAIYMLNTSEPVKVEKYIQQLETTSLADISVKSIVNAISFLFRSAASLKLDSDELRSQLSTSTVFSSSVIDTIIKSWELKGRQLISSSCLMEAVNVGQLLDMQWKVGMAMSSDDCRNLHSPFVTLLFTVAQTGGTTSKHSVEMTLSQFRNFSNQLKEMATLMETV